MKLLKKIQAISTRHSVKKGKTGNRKHESAFEQQLRKEASDGCFEVSSEVASDADTFSLAAYDTSVDLSRVLGFVSDSSCGTHVHNNNVNDDNDSLSSEEVDLFDSTTSSTKLKSKSNITETTCKSTASLGRTSAGGSMKSNQHAMKTPPTPEQLQPYNADKKKIRQPPSRSVSEILEDEHSVEISPHIITEVPAPSTIIDEVNNKSIKPAHCSTENTIENTIPEDIDRSSAPLSAEKLEKHERLCTDAMVKTSNFNMNDILHQDEPISDILPHFNRWKKNQQVRKVLTEGGRHSSPDHDTEETNSTLAMLQEHEDFDPVVSTEKLKVYDSPPAPVPSKLERSKSDTLKVYETPPAPTLSKLERLRNQTKAKRISLRKNMRKHMNQIKSTPNQLNRPTPSLSIRSTPNEGNNFYTVLLERELFHTTPTSSIITSSEHEDMKDDVLLKEVGNVSFVSEENEVIVKGKCVICAQNVRTHVALPCMHFSFCVCCSNDILAQKEAAKKGDFDCPVCGEKCVTFSKLKF